MSEYKVEVEWLPDPASPYKRMARMGSAADKLPEVTCVTPPEFKKGIPNHWSPEHLFVSSCAACFFTTFTSISDSSALSLKTFKVKATGILAKDKAGKEAMTRIDLYPEIVVEKDADIEKAKRIAEKAEANCLIANSMKSEIVVHPAIRKA
ncbi:MAG: OsmC family protein [Candidatus Lokiarchaeota archaeon]|nr:OsmC family protein [Candidatus Lokiarchaeota archaeon]